ncbi:podoplanin [Leptonychotes weddellii]|uniref:Podoplanin n=1 Tax=Leptonychotes weddellii TaxID=9713 RepID=A0A7F8QJ49_LEPWE|nr:podoplanin [Leptonychotes weddellii]
MLTPRKVSYCKVCSSASAGEGSLGISPTLGLFCSLNSSPCSLAPLGKGLWLQSFFIFPQHRNQLLGPKENKSTEKMWKVPVLLLVLGSAWLWDPAGASTVRPEDDITPGVEDSVVTLGAEDNVMTPGTSEEPYESGLTALGKFIFCHLLNYSYYILIILYHYISFFTEKVGEDTETTVEKDGLATVTLVGIIVGVLLAIGFIGGIIIVVARKMSGRYSP